MSSASPRAGSMTACRLAIRVLSFNGHPVHEPHNLGGGWVGFNFARAFDRPVKVINDAAMQALGSYQGGRMLFWGLGAGRGTAMIVEGILEPMELAHLPYKHGRTFEDYVGVRGMKRFGKKNWRRHVADVVERIKQVLEPNTQCWAEEMPDTSRICRWTLAWVTTGTRLWEALASGRRRPSFDLAMRKSPPPREGDD